MSVKTINIGTAIDLPKLLDTRLLIQAGSGGGKSYALRKVIESVGNQVQQIILDPEGEFITLREKYDFALVGKGGDIPLTLKYAETLAHKLLETGMSAIIDLYELKHHERILFVKRFLDAMINAPKELWHSCLIYVDEAHIFCPESSKAESMASVIDLCTRGRKRGFAAILATQRLSKLHKDAAAECLNKLIGRTGLDIDRKRAGEELGMTTKQDLLNMRDLQPGEFHAFGPAISNEVIKFKVGKVITTHPEAGKRITTVPPTPDAIKKIVAKLRDIPEEAERDLQDKAQMRAEITRLRSELTRVQKLPTNNEDVEAFKQQIALLKAGARKDHEVKAELSAEVNKAHKILHQIHSITAKLPTGVNIRQVEEVVQPIINRNAPMPVKKAQIIERETANLSDKKLGRCALTILQFLAAHRRPFTKAQIGVATVYSPTSSGFNNSLSELNTLGLINRDKGLIEANRNADIHNWTGPLTEKKYDAYTFKDKLGKCEREIYEVLLESPHDIFSKDGLASRTTSNYSPTSSGYNNALSTLNTLGLIHRANGAIKLNPELIELL